MHTCNTYFRSELSLIDLDLLTASSLSSALASTCSCWVMMDLCCSSCASVVSLLRTSVRLSPGWHRITSTVNCFVLSTHIEDFIIYYQCQPHEHHMNAKFSFQAVWVRPPTVESGVIWGLLVKIGVVCILKLLSLLTPISIDWENFLKTTPIPTRTLYMYLNLDTFIRIMTLEFPYEQRYWWLESIIERTIPPNYMYMSLLRLGLLSVTVARQ